MNSQSRAGVLFVLWWWELVSGGEGGKVFV